MEPAARFWLPECGSQCLLQFPNPSPLTAGHDACDAGSGHRLVAVMSGRRLGILVPLIADVLDIDQES